jgi:hypothetical protein
LPVAKPVVSNAKAALKTAPVSTSNLVNDYAKRFAVTSEDLKAMSNVQHLQTYDVALQTLKNNIRKILNSEGTRQSKADRIKDFLLHPINDPATKTAIINCAMESIQSAKTMMNKPTNQTR